LHGKPRFAAKNSGIDHFTRHKTSLVLVMSLKESQQRLRAFAEDLERLVESRTSNSGNRRSNYAHWRLNWPLRRPTTARGQPHRPHPTGHPRT